jgi:hypothetical protein
MKKILTILVSILVLIGVGYLYSNNQINISIVYLTWLIIMILALIVEFNITDMKIKYFVFPVCAVSISTSLPLMTYYRRIFNGVIVTDSYLRLMNRTIIFGIIIFTLNASIFVLFDKITKSEINNLKLMLSNIITIFILFIIYIGFMFGS